MPVTLHALTPAEARADLPALAEILHAVVLAGASVSFVLPFSPDEARAFWQRRAFPAVDAGHRVLLVARDGARTLGTVMLDTDMPPNQPHRAEVTKLLVHPDARRQGIATRLMQGIEVEARARNRSLLTLDTWTGGPAETLYRGMGYVETGRVPGFFLHPTAGCLESTTYFHKVLP